MQFLGDLIPLENGEKPPFGKSLDLLLKTTVINSPRSTVPGALKLLKEGWFKLEVEMQSVTDLAIE